MATRRQAVPESTPQVAQSTPASIGVPGGGVDYTSFIWQQLNEIQRSIGEVQSAIGSQKGSIDKLETKVSGVGDKIHAINIKLAVAGALIAVALAVGGWIFKEVWAVAKPVIIQKLTADSVTKPPAGPPR